MMKAAYAIQDIRHYLGKVGSPVDLNNPEMRYLCSLISEMAYYHVPQYEIDSQKRAKIIPSSGYQQVLANGKSINITQQASASLGDLASFVIEDRGVVAAGIIVRDTVFVGFRGTRFLFDWKINLDAELNSAIGIHLRWPNLVLPFGRVHRGYAEEAYRISQRILKRVAELRPNSVDQLHFVLTGHSLGGAVAALASFHLKPGRNSVCVFGSPRYCDTEAFMLFPFKWPIHIRRQRDFVPYVPPKRLGYADPIYEFDTSGNETQMTSRHQTFFNIAWKFVLFVARAFSPHSIERYRKELGAAINAPGADLDFASIPVLSGSDVEAD